MIHQPVMALIDTLDAICRLRDTLKIAGNLFIIFDKKTFEQFPFMTKLLNDTKEDFPHIFETLDEKFLNLFCIKNSSYYMNCQSSSSHILTVVNIFLPVSKIALSVSAVVTTNIIQSVRGYEIVF